jgi:hypothetical protein
MSRTDLFEPNGKEGREGGREERSNRLEKITS